ncbi:MAG: hypothetical protein ABFD00_02435, partial [Chloroherpetonaceae bacterium]
MAEFRQIYTRIWKDNWFSSLENEEKLFFIYLFSNEMAEVGGIYELQIKYMALETGIPEEKISIYLEKFEKDKKVFYRDGWVWVKNLRRYSETGSEKIKTRIFNLLDGVPDCELKKMYCDYYKIPYQYHIDTVSTPEKYRINTVSIPTLQYNTINTDTLIKRDININNIKLKENNLKENNLKDNASEKKPEAKMEKPKEPKPKLEPSDPKYWNNFGKHKELAMIFSKAINVVPIGSDFSKWNKGFNDLVEAGITA